MKKLLCIIALASSLQLNCAFTAVKKIGKTVCVVPLTALTVGYAYENSVEKELAAKHESGHAIIACQKQHCQNVSIKHDFMNKYSGVCSCLMINNTSLNDTKGMIALAFGGLAQDLKDQHWLQRQNFMELELGIPLTRTQKQLSDDLEYIDKNQTYKGDFDNAYFFAFVIARYEQFNQDYQNSNYYYRSSFARDYKPSLDTVKQIENRVQVLLIQGLQDAKNIVALNQSEIDAVAQELYDKEFLSGDEVRAIIKNCK